jgi:Asp/Glu/hydantoin racemase
MSEAGNQDTATAARLRACLLNDPNRKTVVGICEASMIETVAGECHFGVATVTSQLAIPIE